MIINSLIKEKLFEELFEELRDQYPTEILNKIIKKHIQELNIPNLKQKKKEKKDKKDKKDKKEKKEEKDKNTCCARIWGSHYGIRCSRVKIHNTEYCKQHNRIINDYGKLLLNRYDEKRPLINDKGNNIPWYNHEPLEILDILIGYQSMKLIKQINITP